MNAPNTDKIEKRIELSAPIERVWKAVTDHQQFGLWFGCKLESPFVVGERTKGRITIPGYEHMIMDLLIEHLDEPSYFALRWDPTDGRPNFDPRKDPTTLVEFRLEKTATGTLLKVSESGFDALPDPRRLEHFKRNEGGWTGQMENISNFITQNP